MVICIARDKVFIYHHCLDYIIHISVALMVVVLIVAVVAVVAVVMMVV